MPAARFVVLRVKVATCPSFTMLAEEEMPYVGVESVTATVEATALPLTRLMESVPLSPLTLLVGTMTVTLALPVASIRTWPDCGVPASPVAAMV